MQVVDLCSQRKILNAEVLRNVFNGLGSILGIEAKPPQARPDEGQDFAWIVSDLFVGHPNPAGRIKRQVIAGIRELVEAFPKENQLSRRTEKTCRDPAGPQSQRKFFGSAYDQQHNVFVWRQTMMSKNQLRQEIDRAAARGNSDDLALELLDGFYFSHSDEIELRL